jgi:hypothetical protein
MEAASLPFTCASSVRRSVRLSERGEAASVFSLVQFSTAELVGDDGLKIIDVVAVSAGLGAI